MIQKLFVLRIFALLFAAACQTQNSAMNDSKSSNTVANNSTVLMTANTAASPANSEDIAAQTISVSKRVTSQLPLPQ